MPTGDLNLDDERTIQALQSKLQDKSQLRLCSEILALKEELDEVCKPKRSLSERRTPTKPPKLTADELLELHNKRRKRGHRRTHSTPLRFTGGLLVTDS